LAELGNWILNKLERAIPNAPELQEHLAAVRTETRDELAEERGFHERFIESRTRVYIGRQQLQDELKAFVMGAEAKPCLVTGPSGSGKSAALEIEYGLLKKDSVQRRPPQEGGYVLFCAAEKIILAGNGAVG
jgi:predicted AAA+ superfamily ATPase